MNHADDPAVAEFTSGRMDDDFSTDTEEEELPTDDEMPDQPSDDEVDEDEIAADANKGSAVVASVDDTDIVMEGDTSSEASKPFPIIIDLDDIDETTLHTADDDSDATMVKEEAAEETSNDATTATTTATDSADSTSVVIKSEIVDDEAPEFIGTKFRYGRKNPIDLTGDDDPMKNHRINPTDMEKSVFLVDLTGNEPLFQETPLPRVPKKKSDEQQMEAVNMGSPSTPSRVAADKSASPDIQAKDHDIEENGELGHGTTDSTLDFSEPASDSAVNSTEQPPAERPSDPNSHTHGAASPTSTDFWDNPDATLPENVLEPGRAASDATGQSELSKAEKFRAVQQRTKQKIAAQKATASPSVSRWHKARVPVPVIASSPAADVPATDDPATPHGLFAPSVEPDAEDSDATMEDQFVLPEDHFNEADRQAEKTYLSLKKSLKRKRNLTMLEHLELGRAEKAYNIIQNKKKQTIVIDASDHDQSDGEHDSNEIWEAEGESAARSVEKIIDKARAARKLPGAQKVREKTARILKDKMRELELAQRKKAAEWKAKKDKKASAGGTNDDASVATSNSKKTTKKPTKTKFRLAKPNKDKTSKLEREANERFRQGLAGLTHEAFGGDDDDDTTPNFRNRTKQNNNRADALKDLLLDIPEEDQQEAKFQNAKLTEACKVFPQRFVSPDNNAGFWKVRGLQPGVVLRHHQIIGAGWMRSKEEGKKDKQVRGGMLCDDMGLGKTLQAIAMMLAGRAHPSNVQATLIIAPAGVVDEWIIQLTAHVDSRFRSNVVPYVTGSKLGGPDVQEIMENAFCVVTSYGEVIKSFEESQCPNGLIDESQVRKWYAKEGNKQLGLLHRIAWHRVILDEAQQIKNWRTGAAQACYLLESERRWLLTGTPLINDVDELYSYMLMIRHPMTGSREQFLSNFKESELSMKRMRALLSSIMLRRNYQSRLFNKRIMPLPTHYRGEQTIDFSRAERAIYNIFKLRMVSNINMNLKKKHRAGLYRHIFKMMTHLRQLTCHWLLGAETFRNMLTESDRTQISRIFTENQNGAEDYHTLKSLRETFAKADSEHTGSKKPDFDKEFSGGGLFGAQDPTSKEMLDQMDALNDADAGRDLCKLCSSLLEDTVTKTSCGHMFCEECLEHQADTAALDEQPFKCIECDEVIFRSDFVKIPWQSPDEKKGDKKKYRENQDKSWVLNGDCLMSSSKLIAAKALIQNWLLESSETKIIVYTQWLAVIKCLQRICKEENWSHETFHGGKSVEERNNAKRKFISDPAPKILIASLRAGGTGLNLTAADRVLNLDLWWNYAAENQAYHRIYRFGQEKVTKVQRLIVRDTIDEDLAKMQARKQKDIDEAMGENGKKREKMSMSELLSLFGTIGRDERGNPFIIPDDATHARSDLDGVYMGGERGRPVVFEDEEEFGGVGEEE